VQFPGKRRVEASELLRTGRLRVGMSIAFPDGEAS
jgi:hypothetical protein